MTLLVDAFGYSSRGWPVIAARENKPIVAWAAY
jgi:hypothetical protein